MAYIGLSRILVIGAFYLGLSFSAVAGTVPVPALQGPIPVTAHSHEWNSPYHQVIPTNIGAYGYIDQEYFYSGIANVYNWDSIGPATLAGYSGPYQNRLIIFRPADPRRFSGRVVFELLNSTEGYDIAAMWEALSPSILKNGDIYVGVTTKPHSIAQLITFDPKRYGTLSWANPVPPGLRGATPGWGDVADQSTPTTQDGLVWDIVSQAVALLRSSGPGNPLNGFAIKQIYAAGYSQSACLLSTYINAIQPWARQATGLPLFDGYLLASGAVLYQINQDAPTINAAGDPRTITEANGVPVIRTMSQSDFADFPPWSSLIARRADADLPADRFRLIEVPGPAHGNVVGGDFLPDLVDTGKIHLVPLGSAIPFVGNDVPYNAVIRGAYANLDQWVRNGTKPRYAPRINVDAVGAPLLDAAGNATGGLRTPWLDVPIATYYAHNSLLPGSILQWAIG